MKTMVMTVSILLAIISLPFADDYIYDSPYGGKKVGRVDDKGYIYDSPYGGKKIGRVEDGKVYDSPYGGGKAGLSPDKEQRQKNIDHTIHGIELAYAMGIPTMRVNTGTWGTRKNFDDLTPIYPNERLIVETTGENISARFIERLPFERNGSSDSSLSLRP